MVNIWRLHWGRENCHPPGDCLLNAWRLECDVIGCAPELGRTLALLKCGESGSTCTLPYFSLSLAKLSPVHPATPLGGTAKHIEGDIAPFPPLGWAGLGPTCLQGQVAQPRTATLLVPGPRLWSLLSSQLISLLGTPVGQSLAHMF